jgi:YesN/AraC family two-component response regulator
MRQDRQTTILVVDDEPMTRDGLKKTLETWGAGRCSVISLDNGRAALELLERESVDLVITDIRMPEISGLDLTEMLEQRLGELMPPVILLSGYSEFEYAHRAIRLGVVNYLLKPISNAKLIEAVEKALIAAEKRNRIAKLERIIDPVLEEARVNPAEVSESIREALRFVDEKLSESFGLQDVADHVHLNPSYFSVLFKEQMQMTFSEYLTRRRLQKAKELLVQSRLPIAEIAEAVGYNSAKYFNKIFKEYEGDTPSQYRANMIE